MAGRTLPNLKLINKWPVGSSGWGPDMDNNLNLIDALLFLTVLSATIVAPPGSPAQGDRYIVGVGGTGAWAGNDNKVALFIDAAWVFITPSNGWTARVLDAAHTVRYTGSAWTSDGGAVTSVSGHAGDVTLAQLIADGLEATSRKGAASGYAPLDAGSKVPIGNLPSSVVGALEYQGTWNASTNVPPLASGTGTKGFYYKVSTAGTTTIDGNSQWNPGDMIAYDGATWDKIDGIMSEVISVVGLTGLITLTQLIAAGLAPRLNPTFTGPATIADDGANTTIGGTLTVRGAVEGPLSFLDPTDNSAQSYLFAAEASLNGLNIKLLGNGTSTPGKTVRIINGRFQIINDAYTASIFDFDDSGNLLINGVIHTLSGAEFDGPVKITGPLKVAFNLGGTDTSSASAGELTAGWNLTNGEGEVDFINDYWTAAASYIWWQRTGTGTVVQLMRLNPDGSLHLGPAEVEVAPKDSPRFTGPTFETSASNFKVTGASAGFEIGDPSGTANTPYLDFHSNGSAANLDYDVRAIVSGGGATAGGGTLNFQCLDIEVNGTSLLSSPAAFTLVGKPAASQVLNIVIGVASTLAANFAGAVAFFSAAATTAAAFTVKKITVAGVVTTIGTAQLAAGSSRALTLSTQAAVSFAAGDVLQLVGPATQDATLADGGITFVLTKT